MAPNTMTRMSNAPVIIAPPASCTAASEEKITVRISLKSAVLLDMMAAEISRESSTSPAMEKGRGNKTKLTIRTTSNGRQEEYSTSRISNTGRTSARMVNARRVTAIVQRLMVEMKRFRDVPAG
ncbi:hypothetical protein J8273_8569 [Carpediemonas membranifera]|uniref:Uncharacterized protein n=1 Tax=Carpediemonas membranifera TaxID=201153 RepID=A0A8J6BU19_9EUKA|nr:hypothetical protein J8273_8569 [Carpediemonas membranifera]|eukprot:KAG9389886.1 hypothetical protein J8273_8569 [Carpediemonas membranifera]